MTMTDIQGGIVTIMVSNINTSVEFYTETLGFKLKNRFGDHWADIEGPGIAIGLHPASKDVNKGNNLSIGLKVKNLDQTIETLGKQGVKFEMNKDSQIRLAYFNDPDGNSLYLVQSD